MTLDLRLSAHLPPSGWTLDQGADAFVELLRALGGTRLCDGGWIVATPREPGDGARFDPLAQPGLLADWLRERQGLIHGDAGPGPMGFDAYATQEDAGQRRLEVQMVWQRDYVGDALMIDFTAPHPRHGLTEPLLAEIVQAIVGWRRPMHLSIMPTAYRRDHWPVDRLREAVGWIGWLPFALPAGSLPEAHRQVSMAGGTYVAGQPELWSAADGAAVVRAQALDLALNSLGVLPSAVELQAGTWGQGVAGQAAGRASPLWPNGRSWIRP
jgi:hypothetical protein